MPWRPGPKFIWHLDGYMNLEPLDSRYTLQSMATLDLSYGYMWVYLLALLLACIAHILTPLLRMALCWGNTC